MASGHQTKLLPWGEVGQSRGTAQAPPDVKHPEAHLVSRKIHSALRHPELGTQAQTSRLIFFSTYTSSSTPVLQAIFVSLKWQSFSAYCKLDSVG